MAGEIVPMKERAMKMREFFKAREADIGTALANVGLKPERIIRAVFTAAQKNPAIYECEINSIYKAVLLCAQAGLVPDGVTQQAHLIPYNDKKKGKVCNLIIGYRGMLTLVRRSGEVDAVWAAVVREKDTFTYERGTEQAIKHEPFRGPDGGRLVAAYAVARFKSGNTDFEVMEAWEIDLVRARSGAKDEGPWVTDTAEMWKKTVMRRLCKRLPQSEDSAALIEMGARAEAGRSIEDIPVTVDATVEDAPADAVAVTGEVTNG